MGRFEDAYRVTGGRGRLAFTTSHGQDTFNTVAVTLPDGVKPSFDTFEPKDQHTTATCRSGRTRSEYINQNSEQEMRMRSRGGCKAKRRALARATSSPGWSLAKRPATR